jgi:uncharacterized protein (TIGR02271 family)
MKTGEVTIGKHVETETARVSVPIEKERVVIERVTYRRWRGSCPCVAFGEAEVTRVELYEETLTFAKKPLSGKKSELIKW